MVLTFNDVPTEEEKKEHIYIELPGMPPNLNYLLGRNKYYIHRLKKNWEGIIEGYKPIRPKKPIDRAIIYYIFHFKTNRRQDPDNMASAVKFINDGLVNAGFLADDTFDNVDIRIRRGQKSPEGEFTEIVIIDLNNLVHKNNKKEDQNNV
jgi:hypothetical protein